MGKQTIARWTLRWAFIAAFAFICVYAFVRPFAPFWLDFVAAAAALFIIAIAVLLFDSIRSRFPMNERVLNNPWNKACRTSFNLVSALTAIGFLLLLWQSEQIAGADWTHVFDFVSFVKKWRPVSRYPDALSVALGAAMFLGIAVGTFFGTFMRIDHRYTRSYLSTLSIWKKAPLVVGVFLLLALPFITLGPFDEALRSDRGMAFVVNNELASVMFVVAMYCGYCALSLGAVILTRHFVSERLD